MPISTLTHKLSHTSHRTHILLSCLPLLPTQAVTCWGDGLPPCSGSRAPARPLGLGPTILLPQASTCHPLGPLADIRTCLRSSHHTALPGCLPDNLLQCEHVKSTNCPVSSSPTNPPDTGQGPSMIQTLRWRDVTHRGTRRCTEVTMGAHGEILLMGKFQLPRRRQRDLEHLFAQKGEKFWKEGIRKWPERWQKAVEQNGEYVVQ